MKTNEILVENASLSPVFLYQLFQDFLYHVSLEGALTQSNILPLKSINRSINDL